MDKYLVMASALECMAANASGSGLAFHRALIVLDRYIIRTVPVIRGELKLEWDEQVLRAINAETPREMHAAAESIYHFTKRYRLV